MSRTLASFLADLPEADLLEMRAGVREARQRLRQEDDRLRVEEALIGDALSRQTRRTSSASKDDHSRTKLSRGQVLRMLAEHNQPVTPAEAIKIVRQLYPHVSDNSVRAHIMRLTDNGRLTRLDGGRYKVNQENAFGWDAEGEAVEPQEMPLGVALEPSAHRLGRRADQASANGHHPAAEDREMG